MGGLAFEIRRLTNADVEGYRDIRLAALHGAPDAFGSVHEVESERPISHFERRLANSTVFGAYADSRIIATASFTAEAGPKERHKGTLGGMYVRPEARRRGIGAGLIQAIVNHATGLVEQILLAVVEGNEAAIALYERFDFTAYGREPRSLKRPAGYSDEILMVKFLRHSSSR